MNRKLHLTVAGRWFLAFTVGMGVVALISGNNAFYLIESLLLSGLILSGILSERAISSLELEFARRPATAGAPSRDLIHLRNRQRFPIFCVEIGEWKNGKFIPSAYIPRLSGQERAVVPCTQHFASRGIHEWDGIAIATSYPFGFARKVKVIKDRGRRVIWPVHWTVKNRREKSVASGAGRHHGNEISDGELRQFTSDDDSRMIVWTLSAKGTDPLVRMRRSDGESPDITLDLRIPPGAEFEARVAKVAQPFHQGGDLAETGSLILVDWKGRRKFHGRVQILNQLATVQAAGQTARAR